MAVRGVVRTVAGAVAALGLVAGCGANGDGEGDDGGGAAGGEDLDPIAEFLNGGDFDEEAGQRQFLEQERERQTLVAECMAAQGFDYVAIDPDQGGTNVMSSFPGEGLSPAEFVEEYGYGLATLFEEQVAPVEDEYVDPNAAAVEAMSETERQAWDTALYGTPETQAGPPVGESGEEVVEADEGVFYGGGCDGEASEAVYGDQEAQNQDFNSLFEDYDERLRSDRRIIEAEEGWRSCMAERGYDFVEVQDAPDSVNQRMQDEVWDDMDPTAGLSEAELAALTPEELDALLTQEQPQADPVVVAEIAAYELEVAGADFDCAADIRAATAAIGQDFLDEHRAEFERLRDSLAEQNGSG